MIKTLKLLFPDKRSLTNFILVALCSQIIYAVLALKGAAFQQMTDMWSITATQLGGLLSVSAFVGTFSYLFLGWMHDRFSVRFMLSTGIAMTGVLTFFIVFTQTYWILIILFIILGLLTEGYAWPAVLNAVRQSADGKSQGKAFGILEFLRGSIEFAQNAFAIWLFVSLGESVAGLQGAMATNATIMIILGIIFWIKYPEKVFLKAKDSAGKTKESFIGFIAVMKLPEVWLVGITGASIYAAYAALPYFQLFLKDEFHMTIAAASIFALFNTSFTRLLIAPVSGVASDHLFKGATNAMRVALGVMVCILLIMYFVPKDPSFLTIAMVLLVSCTIMIYFLRPLYFVPVGEMNMPFKVSGSVMALASLLVYSPAAWAYILYGYITDTYKDNGAYEIIFMIMIGWATVGIICATILKHRMKYKREELEKKIQEIDEKIRKIEINN